MSRSAKSLLVSVFALVVFGGASIWVANQQVNADTVVTTDTMDAIALGTASPEVSNATASAKPEQSTASTPNSTTLATTITEPEASFSPTTTPTPSLQSDTQTDVSTAAADLTIATPVQPRSRAPLHWAILITDALIVLGLLIALTVRILGKILNPTGLGQPATTIAPATAPTGKPKTIDDLNIDIS